MRVSEIGEFGLIERIKRRLTPPGSDVIEGIGDDAAIIRTDSDEYLIATCDIQMEEVHFRRKFITPDQLGQRAVAVNISDVAAMGGIPTYLLVSLGLPAEIEVNYIDQLYCGMEREAKRSGAVIVGGNITRSPQLIIDIFLLGKVKHDLLITRSGAQQGDLLLVTGDLGKGAAGLRLLDSEAAERDEMIDAQLRTAHLTPIPRLPESRIIAKLQTATAMIDLSDGLASDLGHICRASGVGAVIWAESLPISTATRKAAILTGCDPLHLALYGGEDYELLFSVPPELVAPLQQAVIAETGTSVTVVGKIVSSTEGIKVAIANKFSPLLARGWDHLAQRERKN
ncbi:thiamine-phosphate kinase [Candidatus Acetothermia bacterium]|jgi:thiamine-monophosphate kinase|nr:thiamine-phosphate kinase [Candidatus Acetothermia bacterium]MCI2426942.1 thiamine-phosphate kinase [Candidatus Acetothermia bacterium]MCI2428640.1 thiamine-phosphate kinase [Candidatus Acetothermia bacterium]